mmetsp:Transcript_33689/g.79950  ORF Transcript_33689/g.79950 Transcript_33689/m.79950 type:complete len:205 (-) Transcript_33689:872-1486(-)
MAEEREPPQRAGRGRPPAPAGMRLAAGGRAGAADAETPPRARGAIPAAARATPTAGGTRPRGSGRATGRAEAAAAAQLQSPARRKETPPRASVQGRSSRLLLAAARTPAGEDSRAPRTTLRATPRRGSAGAPSTGGVAGEGGIARGTTGEPSKLRPVPRRATLRRPRGRPAVRAQLRAKGIPGPRQTAPASRRCGRCCPRCRGS